MGIRCQSCNYENISTAKFCKACGVKCELVETPVPPVRSGMMECSKCGHANQLGKKFCEECGASLLTVAATAAVASNAAALETKVPVNSSSVAVPLPPPSVRRTPISEAVPPPPLVPSEPASMPTIQEIPREPEPAQSTASISLNAAKAEASGTVIAASKAGRKGILIGALVVVAVVLAGGGYWGWSNWQANIEKERVVAEKLKEDQRQKEAEEKRKQEELVEQRVREAIAKAADQARRDAEAKQLLMRAQMAQQQAVAAKEKADAEARALKAQKEREDAIRQAQQIRPAGSRPPQQQAQTSNQSPQSAAALAYRSPQAICADRPNFISRGICENRECANNPAHRGNPYCERQKQSGQSQQNSSSSP